MRILIPGVLAMAAIVVASNILVQFPLGAFLTWGALTYPFAFLVTDLTNRWFGPVRTRRVVYVGFAVAVALSFWLSEPRIAVASGSAFLTAQLLDITVFNRLRVGSWWRAPLTSSTIGSCLDTVVFFSIAFAGTDVPWPTLALGDFSVKMTVAVLSLLPYASLMNWVKPYALPARG